MVLMNGPTPKKSREELKAERRRERWKAFLKPLITLVSIVSSVAMLMAILKSCSNERFPAPQKSPLAPKSRLLMSPNSRVEAPALHLRG